MKELFLRYKAERDVVFVLGAGASHPDGVPLQKHLLPTILSGGIEEIENSEIGKRVIEFITDNFVYSPQKNQYPQLEAVFGFIDYFIQQNESLSSKYTLSYIIELKEYLIKLIHYIVNLQTDKNSKYYHLFWQGIANNNKNISIITLNYDTLLEQAFEFLFKKTGYIDYCFHLMNYDKTDNLKRFNFWINPREPVPVENNNNPAPFKIVKIHGSLNWKYCNCCNQILLTPWDRKIDLQRGKFLGYTYPDMQEYEYRCPLDGTEFQTLIMPPSYVKSLKQPVINQLLSEASREIRIAKKIVFVGYSLSDADVHVKALFQKQINPDTKIIVVNTRNSDTLKNKYYSLSKNINFMNCAFEEMVSNPDIMPELLK